MKTNNQIPKSRVRRSLVFKSSMPFEEFKISATHFCELANDRHKKITLVSKSNKPNYEVIGISLASSDGDFNINNFLPISAGTLRESSAAVRAVLYFLGIECVFMKKNKPLAILKRHPDYTNPTFEKLCGIAVNRGLIKSLVNTNLVVNTTESKIANLEARIARIEKNGGKND